MTDTIRARIEAAYREGWHDRMLPGDGSVDDDWERSWAHTAPDAAPASTEDRADDVVEQIEERIERLEEVAERWGSGGSRRLAQRARDKADGLRVARRLLGPSR